MQRIQYLLHFFVLICFFMMASCDHKSASSGSPVVNEPPLPLPEVAAVKSYADGFTPVDASGIDFSIGYISPTPNPTDSVFFQHPEAFAGGLTSADYDNDGDIDVFIVRGDIGQNVLYQNDGNGSFTEVAQSAGIAFTKSANENYRHSGPAFSDMDGDGYLDLIIGGLEGDPLLVYKNRGDATFENVTLNSGFSGMTSLHTISTAFGDYDKDGDLDLLLTHWGTPGDVENPTASEHLWRNDSEAGLIRFTDVSLASGVTSAVLMQPTVNSVLGDDHDATFTANFVDINSDSYVDLLITSDFNSSRVLLNQMNGTFLDVTDERVIIDDSGMGTAIADFDNDGDQDWFVSAIRGEIWRIGNRIYQNNSGVFEDVSVFANVNEVVGTSQKKSSWGWGACSADFDNDGFWDVYMTNGFPFASSGNGLNFDFDKDSTRVFMGMGDNTFNESSEALNLNDTNSSRAVVCEDFDGDGDVDILQLHRGEGSSATYYRNDIPAGNYISIDLSMPATKNSHALGAKISIFVPGNRLTREVGTNNSFTSYSSHRQYFGLGDASVIDSLQVTWPDGSKTVMANIQVNQHIKITK